MTWLATFSPVKLGHMGGAMANLDPHSPNYADAIAKARAEFLASCPAKDEQQEQPEEQAKRFTFHSAADIINAPQHADAIKSVATSYGIITFYGPSGSAKSFLAIHMADCLGHGSAFFGFKTQIKKVVYINLEGSMKTRLAAIRADKKRDVSDNVRFVTEPFHILKDVEAVAADIPEGAVVFIDTLNAASPGLDENSSRDMGLILEAAKKLQQITKGLVVIVHHSGKDASKGLRGHSSLYAAMDAVIEVGRNGDSRYWRLAKSKEGRDGIRRGFRLKSVGLGYDADGEPITSCVVEEDNTPVQEEEKPLTPSLKYALESLEAALLEDGGDSVHVEAWRKHYYAKSTADNTHAKKTAFLRVRKDLASLGRVTVLDDMYSIPGHTGTTGTKPAQQLSLCRTPNHTDTGTTGTHSFRSVPYVPSSEGPEYE